MTASGSDPHIRDAFPLSRQRLGARWLYLDMGDAMQRYPDSEDHVQSRLVKASSLFLRILFLRLRYPHDIPSEHCSSQFTLWIAA
jgi:hypothetical protein